MKKFDPSYDCQCPHTIVAWHPMHHLNLANTLGSCCKTRAWHTFRGRLNAEHGCRTLMVLGMQST